MKARKLAWPVKFIIPAFAIFIALIFLMAPVSSASHSISPATTTSTNYQPNPTLNTNITWSTYNNGWSPLEYTVNATSNSTLNANYSQFYANPISVNPVDIQSKVLSNYSHEITTPVTNMKWNIPQGTSGEVSDSTTNPIQGGAVDSLSNSTGNIVFSMNTSASATNSYGMGICVDTSSLPSQNMQYDYFTAIVYFSGTQITGTSANIGFNSNHANRTEATILNNIPVNEPVYVSVPLSNYAADIGYSTTNGSTEYPRFDIYMNLPETSTAATDTLTLYDFQIGTSPVSFGTEIKNGTQIIADKVIGNINLNLLNPDFQWSAITSNGYSVAVSQYLQNVTQTQTPITSGNYIEQVGYQGNLKLPSAPGLSYGAANITLNLAVPADQFQVLDINGASYLSTLGNKTNGTIALKSAINPTTTNSYLAYVDYTDSQWQSISHPAGIFTIAGIEYYWFIAVGAIAGLLGLAGGVRHAHNKAEQAEKVKGIGPRGRA